MMVFFIGNEIETSTANQPSYWTLDAFINRGRSYFGSALLTSGRVTISGGWVNSTTVTSSSEIYLPSTGWQFISWMKLFRYYFTLTHFTNNTKVLAAGTGYSTGRQIAEVFDSATNTWKLTLTNMPSSLYVGARYT